MKPLTDRRSRANPELAMLAGLRAQLELLEPVLAGVHGRSGETALRDQGRSMIRVARALIQQLEAYDALVDARVQSRDG